MIRHAFLIMSGLLLVTAPAMAATQHFHTGTGFFVNRYGHVVTNAHVVPQCQSITVDGQPAQLVARDDALDIAVLKVQPTTLTVAPLRVNIASIQPNEKVILMGYPGEAGARGIHSYRTGKMLVPSRQFPVPEDPTRRITVMAIEDIAAKGNSGGPVLDGWGRVIGVIRAVGEMYQTTADGTVIPGSVQKASFAIPLSVLQPYLKSLRVPMLVEHGGQVTMNDQRREREARRFILPIRCLTHTTS